MNEPKPLKMEDHVELTELFRSRIPDFAKDVHAGIEKLWAAEAYWRSEAYLRQRLIEQLRRDLRAVSPR